MDLTVIEASDYYNKGVTYLEKRNYKKAITYFKKAEKLFPCMEVYNNLGVTYRSLGMDTLMWENYRRGLTPGLPSLTGDPDKLLVQLNNNLGLAYYMYGNDDKALEYYRIAIRIDPKAWDAWWNTSTAWLRKASTSGLDSEFASGWEMYRARFLKSVPITMKNDKEDLMYWDTKTPGSSILILVEQGIGDSLMFGRYLSLLPFDKVYVQCDSSLGDLFSLAGCIPVTHASECDAAVAYPICSLGECFPIPPADWLAGKIGSRSFDGFSIGIINSGNPTHANDHNRSVNIARFHRLAKHAKLYNLIPGATSSKYVKALNPKNWIETAEYMNGLDLVISVDTSGIHLCGALGRPGWLLQPYKETDFRWGTVGGGVHGSSVWYPGINIFNNPQSWEFVFDNVEAELVDYISQR